MTRNIIKLILILVSCYSFAEPNERIERRIEEWTNGVTKERLEAFCHSVGYKKHCDITRYHERLVVTGEPVRFFPDPKGDFYVEKHTFDQDFMPEIDYTLKDKTPEKEEKQPSVLTNYHYDFDTSSNWFDDYNQLSQSDVQWLWNSYQWAAERSKRRSSDYYNGLSITIPHLEPHAETLQHQAQATEWDRETENNEKLIQEIKYRDAIKTILREKLAEFKNKRQKAEEIIQNLNFPERRQEIIDDAKDMAKVSRDYALENQFEESFLSLDIAESFLDLATSMTPGVSWLRDIYEATMGKNLITGEDLGAFERTLAVLGSFSGGLASKSGTLAKITTRLGKGEHIKDAFKTGEKVFESAKNLGWNASKKVFNDLKHAASSILKTGKLPENYITKPQAKSLGWDPRKGNLNEVAPGKIIGGDIYKNKDGKLPIGKTYKEADLGYESGYRGKERMVYSDDGNKIYVTNDHYETFTELL